MIVIPGNPGLEPGATRNADVVPAKAGNHFIPWVPIFIGNPGFLLEFTPDVIRGKNDYNKNSYGSPSNEWFWF